MNFKELLEGVEPKMPGAPKGISIMTPQQFVASAGDMPDEEDVAEGWKEKLGAATVAGAMALGAGGASADTRRVTPDGQGGFTGLWKPTATQQSTDTAPTQSTASTTQHLSLPIPAAQAQYDNATKLITYKGKQYKWDSNAQSTGQGEVVSAPSMAVGSRSMGPTNVELNPNGTYNRAPVNEATHHLKRGVAEDQEHLDRIRSLSGLGEATKLPAQTRDLDSQEFQDYMKRIVGTPDLDKAGNVKVDKKGNEKYTTGKTKGDKYKMPYIHRSSVVTYLSPDGKSYDEDAVKKTLAIRPKALLKQNEKMKHSNGEFEQFFNVGFAALVGIALDEQTNNLIVVNTCPGAGSCKVDCFAMKGGKIQFKAAWQSDGRILTYLLNDPDGFFNQLSNEISVEAQAAAKGDKKFPNGWQTTVRWHDAGDFFSPEYLDLALKMAAKHPDVRFYAYTKMAGAALAKKPDNFIINWSEGANTTQEKQVKAQDPNLDKTKNSRIVPEKLFYDLLAKDEKGNLKKTDDGAWQPASPEALAEIKQRIAKEYGISVSSILSYTEYMTKRNSIPSGMKYNVIVAPGEGDVSANDPGVLSTLLLRH
jgi:hypothetical protein